MHAELNRPLENEERLTLTIVCDSDIDEELLAKFVQGIRSRAICAEALGAADTNAINEIGKNLKTRVVYDRKSGKLVAGVPVAPAEPGIAPGERAAIPVLDAFNDAHTQILHDRAKYQW